MTETEALIARLRDAPLWNGSTLHAEAADALEAQAREIARLTAMTEPDQIDWAARCGRAESRLSTALVDVERIDWLQANERQLYTCYVTRRRPNTATYGPAYTEHLEFLGWSCAVGDPVEYPTPRAAIDAARGQNTGDAYSDSGSSQSASTQLTGKA